jgi:hypothetical protein
MHDDYLNEFPFLGMPNAEPTEEAAAGASRESFI